MIYGIGTDILAIARMQDMHARFGARLAQRILAPEELAELASAAQPAVFLAKRFAAKEAFAKAAGTGMRPPVQFASIRIDHDSLGRPLLAFSPALTAWLSDRGIGLAHLSLSDEREHVVAFVILERA